MASRVLLGSLGGCTARSSPPAGEAKAAVTRVCRAAFTSAVNDGDPAPATGSEEDRRRRAATGGVGGGGDGPVGRAAGKAKGAAEEVKEAGRVVKDQAKEVGEDVKNTIKEAGAGRATH